MNEQANDTNYLYYPDTQKTFGLYLHLLS